MEQTPELLDIAKRRGFFWPSFEIYQGCSGFYDYGPLGALLKLRIEKTIRDHYMINERCLLIEAPTLTIEPPWVASGHVKSFADMIADCEKCGEPYRADHIASEKTGKSTDGMSVSEIQKIILENKIKCPKCSGSLGKIYEYNLMFKTSIGPGKNKASGYLRPETAQTTYMPFKRLFEIGRKKLPLGVIQLGKSYRNEISPRKSLVRLREFSQAEVQFFIDPSIKNENPKLGEVGNMAAPILTKEMQSSGLNDKQMKIADLVKSKHSNPWIAYFLAVSIKLFADMGIDKNKLRCRQHKDDERSFYSSDTWDVEYLSDTFGRIELVSIADRTDYDLKRHAELSGQDMGVDCGGKKVIPHVIEVAYGIDRPMLCAMESCLKQDKDRVFFSFPPSVSPYQIAVFPLVKKDGLDTKAREIHELLRASGFLTLYDEGFIGKLYYRQDEAGTPYCVTIDYETIENKTVTIRNRDDQRQIRAGISDLVEIFRKLFNGQMEFSNAGRDVK